MKPEYEPKDTESRLGYLVEECGEVLSGVGKAQRWGLGSFNPELPEAEAETNREWILRELDDLEAAIGHARIACCETCNGGGRAAVRTEQDRLSTIYGTEDCPDCQQYKPTGGTDDD